MSATTPDLTEVTYVDTSFAGSSTFLPPFDIDINVASLVLMTVVSGALLLLAAWVIVVVIVSKGYKTNNFVYYVLSLAIADLVFSIGQLILNPEYIIMPNAFGGIGSPLFSTLLTNISQSIVFAGATQHYLTIAVIAAERLYSVVRPLEYDKRSPPVPIVLILAIFFALNLCATTGGQIATSPDYVNANSVGWFINEYAAIALVILVELIYVALVLAVRRKANHSVGAGGSTPEAKRRLKITKTVLQVGVAFFATAFVFNVVYMIIWEVANVGLISSVAWILANISNVPIVLGAFIDLFIFAAKIDEIKTPSMKYLKKLRVGCFGPPPTQHAGSVVESKRRTGGSTAPTGASGPQHHMPDVEESPA